MTAGALQPTVPGGGPSASFISKFDSNAQRVLFATYFGGADFTNGIGGVMLGADSAIWVTGSSLAPELPAPSGTPLLGPAFVAGISPDGSTVTTMVTAPKGAAGQAIVETADGSIVALGSNRSVLTVTSGSGPSLVGIANSAGTSVSAAVAPDELVSLYGIGLGPATPLGARVVNGIVTDTLGGVQVLFDGVKAPLLYAGPNQINTVVPSGVVGRDTTALAIVTPSGNLAGPTLLVRPAQPDVFPVSPVDPILAVNATPAAALNQDGTLNSSDNPATAGSVISIWVSGAGLAGFVDGEIVKSAGGDYGVAVLRSSGDSLEVLYAGDAPGLVRGVAQVNFRLSAKPEVVFDQAPRVLLQIQIGEETSESFSIYVKP